MGEVRNAGERVDPSQTAVTSDQSLFAFAKEIQWKWPDRYGVNKMVVMFGRLHIVMVVLEMLGDWLQKMAGYKPWFKLRLQYQGQPRQITTAVLQILQHRAHYLHCMTDFNYA